MTNILNWLIWILLTVPPILFFTDLTRNPYYFQIFLLNVIILIFWILVLCRSISTNKLRWAINTIDLPLNSFIIVTVLSFLYTYLFPSLCSLQPEIISKGKQIIGINFLNASIFSEGFKKIIFTLVNVLMAYWIATNFVNENNFNKILHTLFIIGFIAAIYAIFQYFGIELIWPKALNPFSGRPVSTFGNPNFMSSYLVILFPIIVMYYISSPSISRKIFYLLIICVYYISLLTTLTRSSWIGLFIALVFILLYILFTDNKNLKQMLKSNIKWVYLMVILFILSFIFLPQNKFGAPSTIKRITEITEYKKNVYPPIHQRLMIWSCGWEMVQKNPILGQGWGLFELYYPYYQGKYLFDNIYRNLRTHANNAHNELLEVWSQTGTIGLTLYLWFLVTGFVYGIKLTNSLSNDKKIFSLSILAGVIGMFVDNIFGNVSLQFCVPAFLYWWNIGMLTSLDTSRKIYEFRISGIIKLLFSIIILSLCLLVYRAYNQFMGEINYFKGFKYSKRNDMTNSIRYLERAHRYYREVNSEYELGNCYARTGQKDKAEWAYYQALAANCGYDEIFFNLATVYSQKGEKENAILNYTQALYINPISQESYLALSNIFFSDIPKYQTEAIELLKQATKLFPNNPDFWNNLGYLYTTTGNNNLAIEIYRKAFELNPESEQIKHNLETALKKIGKTDDDVFKYDILIKTIEQKINSKDWAEVLVLSKKLVTIAPNSYRARFYLANAYFTTGDIDNAINEYKEAVRISPNNIYAHSNLAIAYLQKGFTELAKEELLKILQIDPQNKFAKEKLESLLK